MMITLKWQIEIENAYKQNTKGSKKKNDNEDSNLYDGNALTALALFLKALHFDVLSELHTVNSRLPLISQIKVYRNTSSWNIKYSKKPAQKNTCFGGSGWFCSYTSGVFCKISLKMLRHSKNCFFKENTVLHTLSTDEINVQTQHFN